MVSTGKNQYTLPLRRYGQRGDHGQNFGEMTAERNAAKARAKAMKNTAKGSSHMRLMAGWTTFHLAGSLRLGQSQNILWPPRLQRQAAIYFPSVSAATAHNWQRRNAS